MMAPGSPAPTEHQPRNNDVRFDDGRRGSHRKHAMLPILSRREVEDGLEVLERFCEKEYGNAAIDESQPTFYIDTDERQPSYHIQADGGTWEESQDRQSCVNVLGAIYKQPIVKFCLSMVMLTSYSLIGGLLFMLAERQTEAEALIGNRLANEQRRSALIGQIGDLFNGSCSVEKCRKEISQLIMEYDQDTGLIERSERVPDYNFGSFVTCIYYSVTLITTIGYGNMSPKTSVGRWLTIIYSLLGISIMLIVLSYWGQAMFACAESVWVRVVRYLRNRARTLKRTLSRKEKMRRKSTAIAEVIVPEKFIDLVSHIEDTLPLTLALLVVLLYMLLCAGLFKLWETKWTYFESFYYFFISLSTIGLGDLIPEYPIQATATLPLLIVGQALVAMCITVLGRRIEAKYMAALKLVEQRAALFGSRSNSSHDVRRSSEPSRPPFNRHASSKASIAIGAVLESRRYLAIDQSANANNTNQSINQFNNDTEVTSLSDIVEEPDAAHQPT